MLNQTTELLTEILNAITGGGIPPATGSATSANQDTQITAAEAANTLLTAISTSNSNNLVNLNEINIRLQNIIEGKIYTSKIVNDSIVQIFSETNLGDLQTSVGSYLNSTPINLISINYSTFVNSSGVDTYTCMLIVKSPL